LGLGFDGFGHGFAVDGAVHCLHKFSFVGFKKNSENAFKN